MTDIVPWRPGDPPVNKVLYEAPNGDLFHPDNDDDTIRDLVAGILVRPDTLFTVVTDYTDRATKWFDPHCGNMSYVSARVTRLLGVRPDDYMADGPTSRTMRDLGAAIQQARQAAGIVDVTFPANLDLVTRAAPAVKWNPVITNKVATVWRMTVDDVERDVFMFRSVFPGSIAIMYRSADSACAAAEAALLRYEANSPTTQRSET